MKAAGVKEAWSMFWGGKKSGQLQSVLAVGLPIIAVCTFLLYCILAHGVHIYYTASFWLFMIFVWSLPASVYFLALWVQERRKKFQPLLDDEYDDADVTYKTNSFLEEEEKEEEDDDEIPWYKKKSNENKKKLIGAMKRDFSTEFMRTGYAQRRKFVPTLWNGLGVTACVFGILAAFLGTVTNFAAYDTPAGLAALLLLLVVISSLYLIVYRSMLPLKVSSESYGDDYCAAPENQRRRKILVVFAKVFFALISFSVVCITILGSLQSFVTMFNLHHYQAPGKLYDVGGGRQMHIHCNGTAGPTVLQIHGWGGQAYDWAWIRPNVSHSAKSCSIDRTGYGWSDPPSCLTCGRTAERYADDLNAVLKAASLHNDSIMLVVAAEAVLEARVFVNKYREYNICSILCVDCLDANLYPAGPTKNPPPKFWDMWRNVLPSGIGGIMAASGNLPKMKVYEPLPDAIHINYIQNDMKAKFPETVVMEYESLPQSVQQAQNAGTFGNIRFVGLLAGLGLNQSGVQSLSTNANLTYVEYSPHDMAFHKVFVENYVLPKISELIGFCRSR